MTFQSCAGKCASLQYVDIIQLAVSSHLNHLRHGCVIAFVNEIGCDLKVTALHQARLFEELTDVLPAKKRPTIGHFMI
jgi:hypothetical protein